MNFKSETQAVREDKLLSLSSSDVTSASGQHHDHPKYDRDVVEPESPVFPRTLTSPSVETFKKASQRRNAYPEIPPELA